MKSLKLLFGCAVLSTAVVDTPFNQDSFDGGLIGEQVKKSAKEIKYTHIFDTNGNLVNNPNYTGPNLIQKLYLSKFVDGLNEAREEQRIKCINSPGETFLFPNKIDGMPCPWQTAQDIEKRSEIIAGRKLSPSVF
ncbi:MAG: hypothetical protein DI586_07575 [Micavibrio aeruginosavorus]|uniref:Uncharacterized protein n=1 Tax=Micavibrio aeruginosavorus TaxID=349221 RepID=A0A2W5FIX3_9BACT|nr:MAG: hypothetical protein DI586_07575 [Micavibrio aeruginosavorus]